MKYLFEGAQQSNSRVSDLIAKCHETKKDYDKRRIDEFLAIETFKKYISLTRNLSALGMDCGTEQDSQKVEQYLEEVLKSLTQ